jgi:hypothetical protein
MLGGWLAMIAGAWFAIGPAISMTWEHGRGPIGPPLGGTTRQTLELLGYFYGLGALIVALGAFAAGRFVSRPHVAEKAAPAPAPAAIPTPVTAPPPETAAPTGAATTGAAPTGETARRHPPRRRAWPFARGRASAPPRGGRRT